MENENKLNQDALDAFLDIGEDIVVGGKTFHIYPVSPGKLQLITKKLGKLQPVIDLIYNQKAGAETKDDNQILSELGDTLSDCIDEIADVFNILIQPNKEQAPYIEPLEEEFKQWILFNLSIDKIAKLIFILVKQTSIVGLLKKVLSPRVPAKKTSTTSTSSDKSSALPSGLSIG